MKTRQTFRTCRALVVLGLLPLALVGCAGPELMTTSSGNFNLLGGLSENAFPQNRVLSIQPKERIFQDSKEPDHRTVQFAGILAKKLAALKLFTDVKVVKPGSKDTSRLVLEVRLRAQDAAGYASRAFGGGTSVLGFAGTVFDTTLTRPLVTFDQRRGATGGMLGTGGLFTQSESALTRTMMTWMARDIAACFAALKGSSP